MIEDSYYENTNSDIVDFAFGGVVGYLNIRGFFKNEKTAKALRFSEILDTIKQIQRQAD